MALVGVICEYNPLHLGHQKQFRLIREHFGTDCGIVCLMSGDYVQRGAPAVFGKMARAKAAVLCGADLVLELPVTVALSSAEGFAGGGVSILSSLCDYLCFGTETGRTDTLLSTAGALLSPEFSPVLKEKLAAGISFPAARQAALEQMGLSSALLSNPNDILAVEYCKAILRQRSPLRPFPILREGSYHATLPDSENPSATALRARIEDGGDWQNYLPPLARECFAKEPVHTLHAAERAILARLRTMSEDDFQALPFGSEGLWRKLMHASRREASLEDIFRAVKSKRYPRTRLNRMVLCAFLGLTEEHMTVPAPYTRVLAFDDKGRQILKEAKKRLPLRNAGEASEGLYWSLENRCADLYGLFCRDGVSAPGSAGKERIYYHQTSEAIEKWQNLSEP